jgi:hypothetical protein
MIIYAKQMDDGTTLYFEEILAGKRNKSLRGITLFKMKKEFDEKKTLNIITNRNKTDILGAKIMIGAGGKSSSEASKNTDSTVANSATTDHSVLYPDTPKKSSDSTERIQKAVTRALFFFKALHRNRHSGEVS